MTKTEAAAMAAIVKHGLHVCRRLWCRCLAELMMLLRADNDSSLNSLHSPGGGGRGVKLSDGSYSGSRSETGDTSAVDPGQVFTLFACLSNQTRILTLLRSSQSFHKF